MRSLSIFILHIFILVILSTLGKSGHPRQKWQHQFKENCDAHLHKKTNLSLTSVLKYCRDFANLLFWVMWAGLAMPTKINGINFFLSACKWSPSSLFFFFLEIFQRYHKLAILVNLVMPGYDFQKNFHFALFFGKINGKIFKKMQNIFLGPLCPNLGKNNISPKLYSVTFHHL